MTLLNDFSQQRDWRTEAEVEVEARPTRAKASKLASKSTSPRLNRIGGGFSGGNLAARAIVVDCNIAIAACGACESWRSALAVVRLMRNAGLESRYTPATWVALRGALKCATLDEGEIILFTVTFCANPADNLTRSPAPLINICFSSNDCNAREASTAFDSMISSGLPLELTQEVTARISRHGAL